MSDNSQDQLARDLAEIETAIAQQIELQGRIPASVLDTTLKTLRTRRDAIREAIAERVGGLMSVKGAPKSVYAVDAASYGDTGRSALNVADSRPVRGVGDQASIPEDLRHAIRRYLAHLEDRYRYLEFKGMGVSDQVPLRLSLLDLYVPLKVRHELPLGETWSRQPQLAGREPTSEEFAVIGGLLTLPVSILNLLQKYDGLVILGDPGAGKTTFLKYLALKLATGRGDPLGLGGWLPILLPASAYAGALAKKDIPMDRFIAEYYRDRGIDLPFGRMLEVALTSGHTLLLLDGIDEVQDIARRNLVVQRAVDFFTFHRRAGNKMILTSRIVGYRDVRPTAEGLIECTLVDFEDDEIVQFVNRWTHAVEQAARGNTQVAAQESWRERSELLDAVQRNPGVRRLATNPLLLTMLALMKRQGVDLPERRVELYQKAVDVLVKHWNLARGLGRPSGRGLDLLETLRILAPLALWMHETSPTIGLVKGEAIRRQLSEEYAKRGTDDPERAAQQLIEDAGAHAGLILERGRNEYGFIHLTFQEYLAAVAIVLRGQRDIELVSQYLEKHVGDDRWHEVSLLTIGHLGIVQQRDEAAGDIIENLIRRAPGEHGQAVVLAGEAVLDAWPGGVPRGCRDKVVDSLLTTLADSTRVVPTLRAAAGRALSGLGDPRSEVMTIDGMRFSFVPPGAFYMGAGPDEHLNHHLNYGYWMCRFPVTNAQFNIFIASDGYEEERYWTQAGWRWRTEEGVAALPAVGPQLRLQNCPVAAVTWHEAVAFTRWLTDWLEKSHLLSQDLEARLPTEAEWEKAARGGLKIPSKPLMIAIDTGPFKFDGFTEKELCLCNNLHPKRTYPWGDEPNWNYASCKMTNLGAVSTVGCFPDGASPYGIDEMTGNVWEWLLNPWGSDWHMPEFVYPYDPLDGRERLEEDDEILRMVRGGSHLDGDKHISCSYRTRNGPDARHTNHGFRVCVSWKKR